MTKETAPKSKWFYEWIAAWMGIGAMHAIMEVSNPENPAFLAASNANGFSGAIFEALRSGNLWQAQRAVDAANSGRPYRRA